MRETFVYLFRAFITRILKQFIGVESLDIITSLNQSKLCHIEWRCLLLCAEHESDMERIRNYFKTLGKGFFNKLFERSIRVYIQNHLGEFLIGKLSTDQVDVGLDGGSFGSLYLNAEVSAEQLS